MFQELYKKSIAHIIAITVFLCITFAYFTPLLEGKVIRQSDMINFYGMSKELADYRESTGEEGLWSNSMFGGMPSYLTTVHYPNNLLKGLYKAINLGHAKPANHLFVYMLGFYICLMAFGVSPWLSIAGAIAFGFSSYFLIIIEAGHVTKAYAIGYMPPIIAGVYMTAKKRFISGGLIFAFFLASQLATRHLQITYYTLMTIILLGIAILYGYIKEKDYQTLWKAAVTLIVGAILAVGTNFPNIYLINEYGKYSMRGKSDLTMNADDKTAGLDKSYATAWSYGIAETGTFLIPNFHGGGASDSYKYSDFHKENFDRFKSYFIQQGYPPKTAEKVAGQQIGARFYWGTQPFTSGPVYLGAIVCLLFVLGLFVVKGSLKWWLVSATLLSVMLGWGKNFMPLTEFFLDYVPGYNKFRTVSMTLVIAEFTIPLLGILGLHKIISGQTPVFKSSIEAIDKAIFSKLRFTNNDALNYTILASAITGIITLFFALMGGGMFEFGAEKLGSDQMSLDILEARKSVFASDAWRSLLFILLGAGSIIAFLLNKLNATRFSIVLAVLLIADLWPVSKRYLNNENFISKREASTPFTKSKADQFIHDVNKNHDRVLNLAANTFNDASTSYFHHSIGGYHGAKMKRYQEMIDYNISGEMSGIMTALKTGNPMEIEQKLSQSNALNMLNTKFVIYNPEAKPIINEHALGSAWLVNDLIQVANADEEILKIKSIQPKAEAIFDQKFSNLVTQTSFEIDSSAKISKIKYTPREVNYSFSSTKTQCAVFSEIYYPKGWNAYINGELVEHFQVNYFLRAMILPAGEYQIDFKFEPKGFIYGNRVTLISSLILLLLIIGYIGRLLVPYIRKK